jgi:hypothetical protein
MAGSGTLDCRACGAAPRPEDLDAAGGAARCSYCGAVTALPGGARARPRGPVGMPRGFRVDDDGIRLRIERRWFSPVHLVFVGFTVLWFAFLGFWFWVSARLDAPRAFFLFPLIHVAVGAGLAYVTLAFLLNRTVVEVDRADRVTVRTGPVPWRRDVEIPSGEVAQVFSTEKRYRQQDGTENSLYAVEVLTRDGRRLPLVRGLMSAAEQALFLEEAIERRLGLPDRPVAGEVPRETGGTG